MNMIHSIQLHIDVNYFLISKGNSNIEKAVDLMTNLETVADYTAMALLEGSSLFINY